MFSKKVSVGVIAILTGARSGPAPATVARGPRRAKSSPGPAAAGLNGREQVGERREVDGFGEKIGAGGARGRDRAFVRVGAHDDRAQGRPTLSDLAHEIRARHSGQA